MGNYFSSDSLESKKCAICNMYIESAWSYMDIQCSKCKERCKGYYDTNCLHTYNIENIKDNCFTCRPKCKLQNTTSKIS